MRKIEIASVGLLIIVALCYMTPLFNYAGYVIIVGSIMLLFFLSGKHFDSKSITFLLLYALSFVVYIIVNASELVSHQLNNAVIMFFTTFTVYCLVSNRDISSKEYRDENGMQIAHKLYNIDWVRCLYTVLLFFLVFELLLFAYANLGWWSGRMYYPNSTFPYGWNHVDMSVFTMGVFALGMKRGYHKSASMLAIVASIVLPSRTWKLYLIVFVVLYLCQNQIDRLFKMRAFNSFFKQTIWIVLLTYFWSLLFVRVHPDYSTVVDSHQGLFDTSNYERFTGILYGIEVIWKKALLFKSVNIDSVLYRDLIPSSLWRMGGRPHNSYVSIFLSYSVVYGLLFIKCLSNVINTVFYKRLIPYYLSYMIAATILHDMFSGIRLVFFLTVIIMPFQEESLKQRAL